MNAKHNIFLRKAFNAAPSLLLPISSLFVFIRDKNINISLKFLVIKRYKNGLFLDIYSVMFPFYTA